VRPPEQIDADTDRDVKPFSNHTEFEIWASRYCYECVNDDTDAELHCPILGAALLGGWPKEWTRRTHTWQIGDKGGSYEVVDTCTEFVQRPEWPGDDDPGDGPPPEPVPECDGQLDLVDAYLPTALVELRKAPVTA
jgi:hypothetical protein